MKLFTYTLGCKVNAYETEGIISFFKENGYELVDDYLKADVIIVNSCTVTKTSDDKTKKALRKYKREKPNAVVCVMGCFSQISADSAANYADIVLGNSNKLASLKLVNEYLNNKKQIIDILDLDQNIFYEEMKINELNLHTRGFIKIQDGCENYCSYCTIPYSRGKIRSRNPESVIKEINDLVNLGCKEIILSGINTASYGRDLGNINFAQLIERICTETSIYRIRISSIELTEITDELLSTLKKYEDRIAKHFHIPMQAGSDDTLTRMNRKYKMSEYFKRIDDIRNLFPGCAITTDCLAGFVGETESEFEETKQSINRISYSSMHIFPYSKRELTKAYQMEGHLDQNVINARAKELLEIALVNKQKYLKENLNTIQEVIIEQSKNDYYLGHSSNYLEIYVKSDEDLINQIIKVKCVKIINNDKIYAEIIK